MALTTYLIRVLPFVLFKKEITSRFIRSFLYYVPYVCLAAMTFPAVLSSTGSFYSALGGFLLAIFLAYKEKSLISVSLAACLFAFFIERIIAIIGL